VRADNKFQIIIMGHGDSLSWFILLVLYNSNYTLSCANAGAVLGQKRIRWVQVQENVGGKCWSIDLLTFETALSHFRRFPLYYIAPLWTKNKKTAVVKSTLHHTLILFCNTEYETSLSYKVETIQQEWGKAYLKEGLHKGKTDILGKAGKIGGWVVVRSYSPGWIARKITKKIKDQ